MSQKQKHKTHFLQIKNLNKKQYFKRFQKFGYIIQKVTLDYVF